MSIFEHVVITKLLIKETELPFKRTKANKQDIADFIMRHWPSIRLLSFYKT